MAVRAPRGNSSFGVEVLGVSGIRKALRPLLEPELTAHIDKANKKGAQLYAKKLRPAVGARSSRMKKAVRVKRAKTGKPGWVIGSRRKVAFFWPFIIGGTRAHAIGKGSRHEANATKNRRANQTGRTVRGIKADPIIERVGREYEAEVARLINEAFAQETGL